MKTIKKMPEGPEVYILAKAFKSLGFESKSYGKHLILKDLHVGKRFDITFGLAGRIRVDDDLNISKVVSHDVPSGDMKELGTLELGLDWITASRKEIEAVVQAWSTRKKQIGALLLDQHEICGIGTAWGSEILHMAKIKPQEHANTLEFLNLSTDLIDALIAIRQKAVKMYLNILNEKPSKVVNEWFRNLYAIREPHMKVYKKGTCVKVSGREFYI